MNTDKLSKSGVELLTLKVLLLINVLLLQNVSATLFFTDHFDYTDGANLGSTTGGGGTNWTLASGDVSQIIVNAASTQASPDGFATASGLGVAVTPTGNRKQTGVQFNGATGIPVGDGNVVYASFLLNVQTLPAAKMRVAYMHDVAASSGGIEVVISSTGQVGIQKKGSGTTYAGGTPVASPGTHLVVMRYTFQSGNDQVAVWVDPDSSSYGVNPAPTTGAFASTQGGGSDMAVAITYFMIESAAVTGPVFWIDEVRLATTWADVTPRGGPVPTPVITEALLSAQGMILRGTNGPANNVYQVIASTNVTLPASNWQSIAAHLFDPNGNFDSTNSVVSGRDQQFFRLLVGGTIPPPLTAPTIANQPDNLTVAVGATANFFVGATGTLPLDYFWAFNTNTPVGGNSSALSLLDVQTPNAGSYRVIVSNSIGSVTSSVALLTVLIPPTIAADPTNFTAVSGGSAVFSVDAAGSAPLRYKWYFNTNTPVAGATNATLTLNAINATNAGTYFVVVTNAVGAATSSVATLTVLGPPIITAQPQNQTVVVSNNATFTVTAVGTGSLAYQWFFNTNTPVGMNSNVFTLLNAQTNDAGTYSVIVTNDYGAVTSAVATLTILSAPAGGGNIYVATNGLDANPGTIGQPTTLTRAITLVQPGGTIYLRGGTYVYSVQITIDRTNGGFGELLRKHIFAYPTEQPVLDFSSQPYGSTSQVSNPRGLQINGHWWHVYGLEVKGSADNGIFVAGNSNIVERCVTHHNRDSGLQISRYSSSAANSEWPAYNLILNCDSYDNFDSPPNEGENADGFACKLTSGPGNVFRGCISHNNIDDGWDMFTKDDTGPIGSVVIDQCVAYSNGVLSDGTSNSAGDRNGFKLGGEGIPVIHTVTRSIAFTNGKNGFTWNSNPGQIRMVNNFAFNNAQGNYKFDQPGPIFINNLTLWTSGNGVNDRYGGASGIATGPNNVFWFNGATKNDAGLTVSAASFQSLTVPPGGFTRNTDGSPNLGNFGKLVASSPLINAGDVPVLPNPNELPFDPGTYYLGDPDIGAVESGP